MLVTTNELRLQTDAIGFHGQRQTRVHVSEGVVRRVRQLQTGGLGKSGQLGMKTIGSEPEAVAIRRGDS